MKVVIFGGSFNPVHLAHINLAILAKEQLKADRVLLVPSGRSFFKDNYTVRNKDRVAMLKLATKGYNFMEVLTHSLPIEDGGLGLVYSIDLIVYLLDNKIIEQKPYFLIGDDLIADFCKWKDVDYLVSKVNLVVARRNENTKFNYPYTKLDNEIYSMSSSEIRDGIKSGNDLSTILNTCVIDYIKKEGLYL